MGSRLFQSARAAARLECARAFLARWPRDQEVLIVAPSFEAGAAFARGAAKALGASFGWHRATLGGLAARLAAPKLAERGLSPVGPLPLQALSSRVVDALKARDALGRFTPVAATPGLPRAIARTLHELRMAGIGPEVLRGEFQEFVDLHAGYEEELARARLADRALVFRVAIDEVRRAAAAPRASAREPSQLLFTFVDPQVELRAGATRTGTALALVGLPLLLLDVPLMTTLERELVEAMAEHALEAFATVPAGDKRSAAETARALRSVPPVDDHDEEQAVSEKTGSNSLERLQRFLFSDRDAPKGELGDDVTLLSAPGESRECVEIARLVLREAARGVPFDRMAILVRTPATYRAHLEEALRRAKVPAYFAKGSVAPDPAGRAFVALLACAEEKLSARRFAEYLSLGQVPDATTEGAPPPAAADGERHVPPDEELSRTPAAINLPVEHDDDDEDDAAPDLEVESAAAGTAPVVFGTLRAPWRWERLLIESAVIGGLNRWDQRLTWLETKLGLDIAELRAEDDAGRARAEKTLTDLRALRAYALPLLADLADLPSRAKWGVWIDRLSALATRAIKSPDRVLSVLAELNPMADVGPVELSEVALVLSRRLTELVMLPHARAEGRVFVGPTDLARGLSFDVVFVPGLAEKIFPQKVIEDPILLDADRKKLVFDANGDRVKLGLDTNDDRALAERLALRLAVGAAERRLVLSYPRVDLDQSRPRVPSFYGLELLRAGEGTLPGFDELARRAERGGAARIGWPAPSSPELAIDEAEYDLALLDSIARLPEAETTGTAHYLLDHEHLARALRFRARRWGVRRFTNADGLVDLDPEARLALVKHGLANRSFSPTALQNFAACPYRFLLYTIHKLVPRDEPAAIEEIDALERGSLVHQVLYELCTELRKDGMLPLAPKELERATSKLDAILENVEREYREKLAPAIERVWQDGIESIRADLREWLRRATEEPEWMPKYLELSFGLDGQRGRDATSKREAVPLDCGIRLRGSIDLVETARDGRLRATDYKTGKQRAKDGVVIGGGETLQPVFYALTLEKLLAEKVIEGERVDGGRLYYATSTGGFEEVVIPLDAEARESAVAVADALGHALSEGFFPAAPAKDACTYCDYRPVCGPYEEQRTTQNKPQEPLARLTRLRGLR